MNDHDLLDLVSLALSDEERGTHHGYRLVARGDVDASSAPQLRQALETLMGNGATMIVLDATDVEFLDSSGLSVIVSCGNELHEAGGRLFIEGMSGAVQRVLEIAGLIGHYRA